MINKDSWSKKIKQDKVFIVAKDAVEEIPFGAYSVILSQQQKYKVGDVAKFIIGSAFSSGIYHVELWVGQHLLKKYFFDDQKTIRMIKIPITDDMKNQERAIDKKKGKLQEELKMYLKNVVSVNPKKTLLEYPSQE